MVQEHGAHTRSFSQNCTNTAKHVNKMGADIHKHIRFLYLSAYSFKYMHSKPKIRSSGQYSQSGHLLKSLSADMNTNFPHMWPKT